MTPRDETRQKLISTAHALREHYWRSKTEPVFYLQGSELDALEARTGPLTPIEAARRDWLRTQRANGCIADAGETWDWRPDWLRNYEGELGHAV